VKEDTELIRDFMRLVESDEGVVMEVGVVEWDGPHTPTIRWRDFRQWRRVPNAQRLAAARQRALQDSRFFRVCQTCQECRNVGHMFNSNICQSCAERDLGVVF